MVASLEPQSTVTSLRGWQAARQLDSVLPSDELTASTPVATEDASALAVVTSPTCLFSKADIDLAPLQNTWEHQSKAPALEKQSAVGEGKAYKELFSKQEHRETISKVQAETSTAGSREQLIWGRLPRGGGI